MLALRNILPFISSTLICSFLTIPAYTLTGPHQPLSESHHLTASAVISSPDGNAAIECWAFDRPFSAYPTVGEALFLGDVDNLTYVVLPPRSKEGLHRPPHPMLFILLSGLAHVTLPNPHDSDDLWIMEGVNNFIVAVDTVGVGHNTAYPSDKETVALQVPFRDGEVPPHRVLGKGACVSKGQVEYEGHREDRVELQDRL